MEQQAIPEELKEFQLKNYSFFNDTVHMQLPEFMQPMSQNEYQKKFVSSKMPETALSSSQGYAILSFSKQPCDINSNSIEKFIEQECTVFSRIIPGYKPTITQNNDGTPSWGKIAGTEYHTGGPGNEAVSDILGGITNNTIGYGYMHRLKDEDLDKSYTYWYATNGSSTKNQSKEFFAEYFSYSMTGSPNNQLSVVRDYFDNAGGFVDSMVEDMLE